jgi:hypothetical protein
MPLFTRESAGEAISLEISWHTGKIHESRLKLVHDVGPSSPLSDRPDYDRCKDHPYPAPGPGVGRAFLPADLRQVSRRHHKRTAQAGRPHSLGARADAGAGPGQGHDRHRLFPAGRRRLYPGPRPGRHHRDAGPQTAHACGKRAAPVHQRHRRGRLPAGFHPALPDGLARPGCLSPQDLGAPWRALRACHAGVRDGASPGLRLAGAAVRDCRLPACVARDQLLAVAGLRDLGLPPDHRPDRPCTAESGRSRLA